MDVTAIQAVGTIFSGTQLAVIVVIFMQLRTLTRATDDMKAQNDLQDNHIGRLSRNVAHIMGRLKIPLSEEEE